MASLGQEIFKLNVELCYDFIYLGTNLTNQNSIQEEIKSSLKSGNACYHSVQNLMFSTFLSKNVKLTLRLLMSYIYIYMELLVKPETLTSYIYGPTFGNAETVSFYLLHNVSTLNQCREVSCVTFVCKHFAS